MKYIKFIVGVIFFSFGLIYSQDVADIIEQVQDKYEDTDFLSAVFKQVEVFKLTGSQSELSGKIYISHGKKYRFESEEQTVVTDGDTIWAYNINTNQVIVDKVRENSGALLPRDLLYKYPKEYYSTLLKTIDGQDRVFLIKLEPKENVYGYLKSIKIWVEEDSWLINKIESTDLRDTKTTFELSSINTKKELPDSFFIYEAPQGVEIMDRR